MKDVEGSNSSINWYPIFVYQVSNFKAYTNEENTIIFEYFWMDQFSFHYKYSKSKDKASKHKYKLNQSHIDLKYIKTS